MNVTIPSSPSSMPKSVRRLDPINVNCTKSLPMMKRSCFKNPHHPRSPQHMNVDDFDFVADEHMSPLFLPTVHCKRRIRHYFNQVLTQHMLIMLQLNRHFTHRVSHTTRCKTMMICFITHSTSISVCLDSRLNLGSNSTTLILPTTFRNYFVCSSDFITFKS